MNSHTASERIYLKASNIDDIYNKFKTDVSGVKAYFKDNFEKKGFEFVVTYDKKIENDCSTKIKEIITDADIMCTENEVTNNSKKHTGVILEKDEMKVELENKLLVFVPMGIPGMGKTTYIKEILGVLLKANNFTLNVLSSDETRNQCMED